MHKLCVGVTTAIACINLALAPATHGQQSRSPVVARTDIQLSDKTIAKRGELLELKSVNEDHAVITVSNGQRVKVPRIAIADLKDAAPVFTQLIKEKPRELSYYLTRANIWAMQNEMEKAIKDTSMAIQLTNSKDARLFVNRGVFFSSIGERDKAIVDYVKATELAPKTLPAYINLAAAYVGEREYDKAIETCDTLIDLDEENPAHYVQRGVAKRFKREWDAAIADFTKALELDADNLAALNSRGFAYYLMGDHKKAVNDFDTVIRLNAQDAMAYNNRGYNLHMIGEYKLALADYNKSLELASNYAMAYQNKAWLLATCPDDELRDGQAAFGATSKACQLRKYKVATDIKALAAAYAEAGDFLHATQYQKRVVEMVEADARAMEREILALYEARQPYRSGGTSKRTLGRSVLKNRENSSTE